MRGLHASVDKFHRYHTDELGVIASSVIAAVAPRKRDRAECWQVAYAFGLDARSKARDPRRISRSILFIKMQDEIYRFLNRKKVPVESELLCA